MKLLALDTSHSACSIALLIDDEIKATHHIAPMQQAQLVLPMIEELLLSNSVTLNGLDALAFGQGPGSFTGVRIAASVMQGLAFATDLPLINISSLAATAQATFNDNGWKKLMVATDARIKEVYWGLYEVNNSGLVELIGTEKVCAPESIPTPESKDWYAIGNAWQEYREKMLAQLHFIPIEIDVTRMPTASAVAILAKEKFQNNDWPASIDAMPVYLRDNVAIKGK